MTMTMIYLCMLLLPQKTTRDCHVRATKQDASWLFSHTSTREDKNCKRQPEIVMSLPGSGASVLRSLTRNENPYQSVDNKKGNVVNRITDPVVYDRIAIFIALRDNVHVQNAAAQCFL
mmetsp:Transcript_62807/g.115520  ORF Transcript_62807/g.115520 Transcript_62807/m.115520 type:complete len:118 (+) Transcript_62807:3-356(+)